MTTKGIEFLRNLKPEDMPFNGEVYERLKEYVTIKRVSDEKYYEDYKRLIFTMQISEFEDSIIKFHINLNQNGAEVTIYSMIDNQWVSILEDNNLFRKYYAKSNFRNTKKWYNYIDQSGIAKGINAGKIINKLNKVSIYGLISLLISESLNFYNSPIYLYRKFRFNGFNRDHINNVFSHRKTYYGYEIESSLRSGIFKDMSFIDSGGFNPTCKDVSLFSLKDIDNYVRELSVELLNTNNSAINNEIMGIDKEYINYRKVLTLIAEINVNKPFFKDIFQRYFQIFNDYNNIEYTLTSLINRISDVVYFIDNYKDYLRRALFNDQISYKGIYFDKDDFYLDSDSFIRDMTDDNGVTFKIVASNDTYNLYRSGMTANSMKRITQGISEKIKKFSHLEEGYIPAEIVLKKIGGKDLYRLIGMLDGNDNIVPFNNPLHLMEIFRLSNIKEVTPDTRIIGEYNMKGSVRNVIKCCK